MTKGHEVKWLILTVTAMVAATLIADEIRKAMQRPYT